MTRACAICGCSKNTPCSDMILGKCHRWTHVDMCSHCATSQLAKVAELFLGRTTAHYTPEMKSRAVSYILNRNPHLDRKFVTGLICVTAAHLDWEAKD